MADTYKIGEAAALLNLKTYVLRFWETEFPEIAPLRTDKGQRLYTPEHLALLERVRYLLHERGLTIGGARKILAEERARGIEYVFGTQGAVKGLDAEAAPGLSSALPASSPEDDEYDAQADESLEEDEEEVSDALPEEAEHEPLLRLPAQPRSRATGPAGPAQLNLPGLDDLAAFQSSLLAEKRTLDSGVDPMYGGGEGNPHSDPDPQKGALPLFAVARAAFLAGKASARGTETLPVDGGDNFIPAGESVLRRTRGTDPGDGLQSIVCELEAIIALLRTPAGCEKQCDSSDTPVKGGPA